jgi:hypothetical protein
MLRALRTGVSFRLAILLTAFASFCFVAPRAVLAFGHGQATADCMAHADVVGHGKGAPVTGMKHHQGNQSYPSGDHQPSCCGLFCMSALVADEGAIELTVASTKYAKSEPNLFSRGPERLDRPPISSLSV